MIDLLDFILVTALLLSGNSTYSSSYDCADYTYALVTELRESNIDAYPVCGWYGHGYHAWVGVSINNASINIEPQTGELVQTYSMDEVWPYIQMWGEYPDYRFFRRCIIKGLY